MDNQNNVKVVTVLVLQQLSLQVEDISRSPTYLYRQDTTRRLKLVVGTS